MNDLDYLEFDRFSKESIYEINESGEYIKHFFNYIENKGKKYFYSTDVESPRKLSRNFFKNKEENMLELLPSM
mgnify:CR=1 FL=1